MGLISRVSSRTYSYAIDCDEISHQIYLPGTPTFTLLKSYFGRSILTDGVIDREKLSRVVFNNEEKLKALNKITHKAIGRKIRNQILSSFFQLKKFVIIDAPLLFESKQLLTICRHTVCISAPTSLQIKRLKSRNNLSQKDALSRINSQMSLERRENMADFVIDNSKSMQNLTDQLDKLMNKFIYSEYRFNRILISIFLFICLIFF